MLLAKVPPAGWIWQRIDSLRSRLIRLLRLLRIPSFENVPVCVHALGAKKVSIPIGCGSFEVTIYDENTVLSSIFLSKGGS
jgi:hypothetical protein